MDFNDNDILGFSGPHKFLSNFYPVKVTWLGFKFPTSENAYQASKSCDEFDHARFLDISPSSAKRLGQSINIRKDWDDVKISIMTNILRIKFEDPALREMLLNTGNAGLYELNTWDDRFWGIIEVSGMYYGENHLGKALMQVRSEIQRGL